MDAKTVAGRWRPVFLAYLLIYFMPYAIERPHWWQVAWLVPLCAVFVLVYWAGYVAARPGWIAPAGWALNVIGFAAQPLGGTWSVFNIYGVAAVARIMPRRSAMLHAGLMMLATTGFGIVRHEHWLTWGSDIFFGALATVGVWSRLDLAAHNAALVRAQDEIQHLAAMAERERIARDLHDLLGHTLTVITMRADLGARLGASDPERARQELEGIAATSREALREVRQAVAGMNGRSLMHEITRAVDALRRAGIMAVTEGHADDVQGEAGSVLAMVVREAVTNVIRHAGAGGCSIGVVRDGARVGVCIADDGATREMTEGNGIAGMRARLDAAGGELTVLVRAQGGVVVSAWMVQKEKKALA